MTFNMEFNSIVVLIAWSINSVLFLVFGAMLTYRKQLRQSPISLPDLNVRNTIRTLLGREPTKEDEGIIEGKPKDDINRFSPSRMPGGSQREHHFDTIAEGTEAENGTTVGTRT